MYFEIYRIVNGERERITAGIAVDPFAITDDVGGRNLAATFYQMGATREIEPPVVGDVLEVRSVEDRIIQVSKRVFYGRVVSVEVFAEAGLLIHHRFVAHEVEDEARASVPVQITYSNNQTFSPVVVTAVGSMGRSARTVPRGPARPSIPVVDEVKRRKIVREELPE